MQQTISMPAVSIVIPTYNIENYIGQCLDSLLAQRFKDFEVIIVDDCSTDLTVEVIENYKSKFIEGQIRIYRLQKNTNDGAATPKNLGIKFSRGKYLMFLDGDDLLTASALEDFVRAAEEFQADMVFTESFGQFKDAGRLPNRKEIQIHHQLKSESLVKIPTLDEIDFTGKVRQYISGGIIGFHWNKIFRREFLLVNGLKFSLQPVRHDAIFSFESFLLARSVRIPAIANFYRQERVGANSGRSQVDETMIRRWVRDILIGASELQDFCQRFSLKKFEQDVVNWFIRDDFRLYMTPAYKVMSSMQIQQIIVEESLRDPAKFIPVLAQIFNIANGH